MRRIVHTPSGPVLLTDTPENGDPGMAVVGIGLSFSGRAAFVVETPEQITPRLLETAARRFAGMPVTIAVTERLILREMREEETELLDALDAAVDSPYTGANEYHGLTETQRHDRFVSYRKWAYGMMEMGLYLVFRRSDGLLIGRAGFSTGDFGDAGVMVSYEIIRSERRKGYGSECLKALISYARELGVAELCALVNPDNAESLALAKRCGFQEDGEWQGKKRLQLVI
ncbi:MAG: GNAT family N-acetyltransferase [Lachnospiraceae bacterium]|jgi:RimJ/RimL family protein N-acetyltransferase|nr:GNAT family N-acetyltransferase [Lachnospiraceae bacterium]MCH4070171.1 GNAT family N-acetyltransferase [Lachnospiraceae bacterium]MCH4108477.1 GNAT family N-acetyltransferase [Lachnospiraceae bacterium]MCI1302508.1 GNAT family N-acetyltransferase [Lachnospiraceae bacterium]MCI1331681.1 GNAT family N-acetyltransferase [Lachnospiraceae bacterium]